MSLPATDQIWPVEERRKDRWTIKRDFALETNEMRPRSLITQKFFEKTSCFCFPAYFCYHLNCFFLPAYLEWRSIMGGKALHKTTEREREPSLTCLTVPSYRTYIPFPSVTSSLSSASNYWWEKAWTYGIREWYMKWKAGNRAGDER